MLAFLISARIPDLDCSVPTRRGEALAVGTERYARHLTGVRSEGEKVLAGRSLPLAKNPPIGHDSTPQLRLSKVCAPNLRSVKVGATHVRPIEARLTEVSPAEQNSNEASPRHICFPQR